MSEPDEYGTACVYCGQEHPRRGGCPLPEDSPDRPAARTARRRSLAHRRPAMTAGGSPRPTDETPGPAIDLFGRSAR